MFSRSKTVSIFEPSKQHTMKHTPEPWNTVTDSNLGALIRQEGLIIAKTRELYHLGIDHEANASRIVACVNACAGIPNETLSDMAAYFGTEGRTYHTLVNDMREAQAQCDELKARNENQTNMIEGLKAEREELLAALESIAELRPVNYKGGREECFAVAVRIAQTAVLKAKGEQPDTTQIQAPVERLIQHANNGQKMMLESVHFYNAVYLLLAGTKPIQVIESLCESILAQNEQIKRMVEEGKYYMGLTK